jgi:hypothetical protein
MLQSLKYELNVLINLAAIDHIIESREAKLIYMIGQANNVSREEVDEMIKKPEPINGPGLMTDEEKFNHLCYIILMMKADGRVLKEEIDFCETIASRLGYSKGVVRELSAHIYGDPTVHGNKDILRQKAKKFRV